MGKHKEKKSKKHKKEKKHKKRDRKYSSSSSSASESEWVEKDPGPSSSQSNNLSEEKRDEWMSMSSTFLTKSHLDRRQEREEQKRLDKEKSKYNPSENVRELNPYWKHGGDGMPSFKKPTEDSFEYKSSNRASTSSWRKKTNEGHQSKTLENEKKVEATEIFTSEDNELLHEDDMIITDKELNAMAAKLVKAEIMGNNDLIKELKHKLEKARQMKQVSSSSKSEEVVLSTTDSKGYSRPLKIKSPHDEAASGKRKKQKVETHHDGERVRYFPDDDKYSLKQMFENEKYQTVDAQNKEFVKMASKIKNQDLDEIFEDKIRRSESEQSSDKKNIDKAIQNHQSMTKSLDNCSFCLQSDVMSKHLMITLGETMFLMLPPFEPITTGHCFIVPIRHVPCATQLDENEWSELMDFRRALTKMYMSDDEDVIFFETATSLHKLPHMALECVPVPKEQGDLAPIYFKKAIDESETEWSSNKKLVSLAGRDVRRAIPKGLPYFCVSFGMTEGYAHVIEDEKDFPRNFAPEIIGGMLDLHHSKWRKPKRESFTDQSKRVKEFSKTWSNYGCTKK